MPHQRVSHYQSVFLVMFALIIGLSFTHSPGTSDIEFWEAWVNNADNYGLVAGYAANHDAYPPLASVILWAAEQVFQPLQASAFLSIKFSIFFFLVATASLFWLWTRDLRVALILYFALLLNSVALGYIDVYFAPPLILSLWMLKEGRWLWFSLLFALATLIKWQPMIIAPFCLLYILGIHDIRKLPQVDYAGLFGKVVAPSAVLTASMLVAFGPEPVLKAFDDALTTVS
jgi:Gpi18-like mannosyltransferase